MILVTGSTGYIGRALTTKLLEEDYEVKLLTRNPNIAKKLFPKAAVSEGDLSNKNSIKNAMKDVSKVIHLAGLVDYKNKKKLFETNYLGTKNLLEHCKNVDKLVFSSSVTVFGHVVGKANDKTICRPTESYGESKMMAEDLIMNSGIAFATLRIAPVYGEGSPWFNYILKMLSWGMPCPKTEAKVQLVHVSDVVRGITLSIDKGIGTFIIADEKPVKLMNITEKFVRHLGKRYWTVPSWMITIPAKIIGMDSLVNILMENRVYDTSRAKKVLGFKPKANLNYELKRMIDWYLAHK